MRTYRRIGGVLSWVLLALAAADGEAQEPLRWKFQPGEKLDYLVVETMTLTSSGKPLEETATPLHQEMDISWTVDSVNADGAAKIVQKIGSVRLMMTGPRGEKIEYDSAGDEATASLAAMVAPIYDALTKSEFTFRMTPRGEMKDIAVSEELLEALKNSPGAAMLGDMATAEGLQRILVKWVPVLPEKLPKAGEVWRSRVELKSPQGLEQIVETSYRYDGTKNIDGRTFAVFRPGLEITFAGKEGATTKVKEQDSSGEILFDVAAGRLQSVALKRGVTTDVTAAGQTVEQKVTQTVEAKLTNP